MWFICTLTGQCVNKRSKREALEDFIEGPLPANSKVPTIDDVKALWAYEKQKCNKGSERFKYHSPSSYGL